MRKEKNHGNLILTNQPQRKKSCQHQPKPNPATFISPRHTKMKKTGLHVDLIAEKMRPWLDARVYFDLYQSDSRTSVHALYLILKGMTSNPKNDFQDKRGRWWSFGLATYGLEPTHNLRAALHNLANEITDKII